MRKTLDKMRQKCEECGIHSICNEDGICADCEYEHLEDQEDDADE